MKISRNGLFCLSLMWIAAAPAGAQEPLPPIPADPPAVAADAQAPQNPVQPPPQQPPQQPAQQPQPPQTEPSTQPNVKLPPPPPKVIDVRFPGEAGFWFGATGWLPYGNQYVDKGHAADFTGLSFMQLANSKHGSFGAEIGAAAGLHNTLRISYWFSKTNGSVTAPTDLVIFGQTYSKGDGLTTNAKLSDVKLSYEYLTWPYPVERRHFRLKTLWQMQYVTQRVVWDNPVKSSTPDVNGNFTSYSVLGSKSFFTPTLGLGLHEYASRNLHFELDATGFMWPHRWQIWDVEATVAGRISHIEIRAGVKGFHYRTSPQADYFFRGTLAGLFAGIMWHSD